MRDVRIVADERALFEAAAEEFASRAVGAAESGRRFAVALAGGSTPRGLYALLAREDRPFRSLIPWEQTHLFWGDERVVPPDHPDSNYRTARETLLSKIPIPERNIHRIRAESADPDAAAREYEADLRSFFALAPRQAPAFDLVLLGMGTDGHTASLFPGSGAVREARHLVTAPWVEALRARRITLTPKAINGAACVLFLVTGETKAEALRAVLEDTDRPDLLPAQAIRPARGALLFLVDRAAASRLRG